MRLKGKAMNTPKNKQLMEAVLAGDEDEVRRLIPLVEVTNNEALKMAVHSHNAACVEMLLPVSNLSNISEINGLILWAVESRDAACLKALLSAGNPKFNNSYPLQVAVFRGYTGMVDLLFDASEPRAALTRLQDFLENLVGGGGAIEQRVAQFQERVERCESEQQRQVLNAEVNRANKPVKSKQKI